MVNAKAIKSFTKTVTALGLLAIFWAAALCVPASAAETFSVVDTIVPIMSVPGGEYTIGEEYGEVEGEDVKGVVVYGNRLEVRPIADEALQSFSSAWVELVFEGRALGYIEKKGLVSFPEYQELQGDFLVKTDDLKLLLLPGKDEKRYDLSSRGFFLARGEVVNVRGENETGGKQWLLLSFSTNWETGDGGVGERYAWALAEDLIALSSYKPDPSKIDEALLPTKTRYYRYGSDGHADFIPVTETAQFLKNGFVIDPKPLIRQWLAVDDMADYYGETGEFEADFITTDMFLHSFHLIFDHMLQKFERTYLAPSLDDSMKQASDALEKMASQLNENTYNTAQDMFSVIRALLQEEPSSVKLSPRAAKEVQRVLAANEMGEFSEITGKKFDYTQCLPRGHYTVLPGLDRYFRAMSYASSAELDLFDRKGALIPENVTAAALISMVLESIGERWDAFEDPIGFLIGAPNAGGSQVYRKLAAKHIGSADDAQSLKNLSDAKKLAILADDIKATVPGPLIQAAPGGDNPEEGQARQESDFTDRAPVFRISSKRFTYDAYVFNQLTSPRVGTDANLRNLPKGTDVMAVLGSNAATRLTKEDGDVKNYARNLSDLKAKVDEHLSEDTVYARWLSALKSSFEDSGAPQFFYRSPAWQWKKLITASASWAELKHDTVLYAEQFFAEGGGAAGWIAGPFEPPLPRGYVEPDPQTFAALLNAAARMKAFIEKFKIEDLKKAWDEEGMTYAAKLDKFSELLETARSIAEKQVAGETLTMQDYASIKEMARSFDGELLLPGGAYILMDAEDQLKMALIVDVASDYFDGRVLEVGTGTPHAVHVFVNDASGGARITRGYMFSYYEFESEKRWTDEEWKKLVYDEDRAEELEGYHPTWWKELSK